MASNDELITHALTRAVRFSSEAHKITDADLLGIAQRVHTLEHSAETCGEELHAIAALLTRIQGRLLEQASGEANRLGWLVGKYMIAPEAKTSGDEPVVFITSNSYMPPLREFGPSEAMWDCPDLWESYVEGVERALEEERVYMGAPEYDNALYVVDLERFAPKLLDEGATEPAEARERATDLDSED